ncbi:MAG TPA: hypothetical protein DDZ84_01730, partial [Firmicutes bacterium]|nr:hypothetical protein [Bacillota bacterium]
TTWEELAARYGRDTATAIMKAAMLAAGKRMGAYVATQTRKTGVQGSKAAWEFFYGPQDVVEESSDIYVTRSSRCAAYDLWKAWAVPDALIAELADAYCIGDNGFACGVDPSVECRHERRIMKGDSECRWVHT